MAKKQLVNELVGASGEPVKKVPKVKGVRPTGSTILIENLNPDEILNTTLWINKDAKVGSAPQAYVVDLGPKVDPDCGLKSGDRVIVQGTFVPVENTGSNQHRTWGIVEIHNIKAVLEEEA